MGICGDEGCARLIKGTGGGGGSSYETHGYRWIHREIERDYWEVRGRKRRK